ncbi:FtsX-like permease family protein [Chitinophaga skermanii]|uniref:FtsX-like permease family protein n=1 Tax=Chitinophaga skermanii TaxID=331697 RepID=A0A327Q2Y3_9BACT|nr:FtsX-like permease family protein [Chitinophaga skermanii]RAI98719.1 FtsX-like permease family protein [Chitinophaga skermanii]
MQTFYSLLKKIIRAGIGRARYWMAYIGLGVAMLLIFIAIQVHSNFNQLLHKPENKNESADFLVINKTITNANSRNVEKNAFTQSELDDLQKQPFVESFGYMTPSQFKVQAYPPVDLQFSTAMFFEAVPDTFIDVKNDEWKWAVGDRALPIVLPNSMLNMYNFGFALSQNLPQISQETVSALPIRIVIYNDFGQEEFVGRIVGFSDRISSILVPQSFMNWANKKYAPGLQPTASRIIIKTKDPGDPKLVSYLEDHGFSTDNDKLKDSRLRMIVQIIVSVIGFFGLVLLLFAVLVFSMFIQLIIAACKKEINLLVTLGTKPSQLKRYLMRQFVPMYVLIGVITLVVISGIQYFVYTLLLKQHLFVSPLPGLYTWLAAAAILLLLYIVNSSTIRKYIYKP